MAVRPILILSTILCMGYVMTKAMQPRGLRYNNPLNIKQFHLNWVGEKGDDGTFVIFDTLENGYRAAARNLRSYRARGITTIREIITKWAPKNENHTESYIAYVTSYISDMTGLNISAERNLDVKRIPYLLAAMTKFENGASVVPSMASIHSGIEKERVDYYA